MPEESEEEIIKRRARVRAEVKPDGDAAKFKPKGLARKGKAPKESTPEEEEQYFQEQMALSSGEWGKDKIGEIFDNLQNNPDAYKALAEEMKRKVAARMSSGPMETIESTGESKLIDPLAPAPDVADVPDTDVLDEVESEAIVEEIPKEEEVPPENEGEEFDPEDLREE